MTPPPSTSAFGKLDGKPIERAYVKVSGMIRLDHAPKEGELVILAVKGEAAKMSVTHVFGTLSRIYNLHLDGAEPDPDLRAAIATYLVNHEDEVEGRHRLPGIDADGVIIED